MSDKQDSNKENTPTHNTQFYIVGIGASAGGVQALKEFFENVPPNSGMAWVVILHLSPDHDSQLTQLLQNVTDMTVTQVTEKVKVQPNHVYVIPPNQHLMMEDGHITVSVNTTVEERRAPVDIFFRTLAESHKTSAVAVVLSGTSANGSMGLKRVKERGGAVFVQNPREAEFSEMPRNSIATEMVDEVLPVADIPAKIIAYQQSQRISRIPLETAHQPQDQQQALREIFTQLRLRTGHDFSNYKRPTLLRRIERRINIHDLPDLPAYAAHIQEHPEEVHHLLKDLLISVTNFFRDKRAFEELERQILPTLFQGKASSDQVRIWVAGCATGEEAYSLAMLCAERTMQVLDSPKVQIFATDIDETAIASARDGFYTLNDAADVSPERLRRFFTKEGEGYRIRQEIREMVLFANHNFLKDPPFSHLHLITCRNVLIYLNHTAQERVMETFHFALNPGCYLFLGTSESADSATDLYSTFSREHHIFQSRQTSNRAYPVPESVPNFRSYEPQIIQPATSEIPARALERITYGDLHQRLLEQYAPPSMVVNEEYDIVHLSERAGKYLQIGGGELSRNLLKLVRQELRLELRSALYQAVQRQATVEIRGLKLVLEDATETLNIQVRPVVREGDSARGFLLVIFSPAEASTQEDIVYSSEEPAARHLEEELMRLKAQLRSSNEQHEFQAEELKAANEELQAMNEELRSAAEELETSKEELQSINEELTTVNQELKVKVDEVSMTGNNLQNLINSTDIGTIFLDRSFRVVLFTPSARNLFNLIPADYGRPLSDITSKLLYDKIIEDAELVLQRLQAIEQEVRSSDDRTYLMRILPYRTVEDRIQGVVITFVDITERIKAEEELRQAEEKYLFQLEEEVVARTAELKTSQQQYQSLVENTPDIIIRWDKELKLVYANSALQLKTGMLSSQLLGKTKNQLGQPAGVATAYINSLQKVFATGEAVEHFSTLTTQQGISQLFTRMVPERNEDGVVETVLTIARDITDIRKAEAEVTAGKNLLQATMDSSLDLIQVFDAVRDESGKIIDFIWKLNNHTAEKAYGNVIGKSLLENNPGIVETGIFDTFKQVTETGIPNEQERHYVYEQFDGWFYQSVVKLGDGIATTTSNITTRKNAELELQQSKGLLQRVIDGPNIGIAVYKAIRAKDGHIIDFTHEFINQASIKMLSGDDFTGKLFTDHGENATLQMPQLTEVIETGTGNSYIREADFRGRKVWFSITNTPLDDDRLVHTWEDVTERKHAEQEILNLKDKIAQTVTDKYESLFNSIDEGFHIMEMIYNEVGEVVDFRYIETNRSFERHTGLKNVESRLGSEVSPNTEAHWLSAYDSVVKSGSPLRVENYNEFTKRWYSAYAFRVGGQGSTQVAVLFDDVTETKRRKLQQEFLLNFSDILRTLTEKETIEPTTLQLLTEFLGLDRSYIATVYRQEDRAVIGPEYQKPGLGLAPVSKELYMSDFPEGFRQVENQTLVVEDIATNTTLTDLDKASLSTTNLTALVVASVRKGNRNIIWSLVASTVTPRTWTKDEVALIETVAERTWATLERVRVENLLRRREAELAQTQEIGHIGGVNIDVTDGLTSRRSPEYIKLHGLPPGTEIETHENWLQRLHPDDKERANKTLQDALAGSSFNYESEYRIIRPSDGQVRWINAKLDIERNAEGHPVRLMGIHIDITERKQAEEALRESELKLRTLIQNLPGAAVFIVDKTLRYLVAEGEALLQAGFKPADIVGKTITEAIPEGAAEREKHYRKALEGEAFNIEHQEHNHTYISRGTPLRNAAGEVYAVLAISYDITDRQKAEEALRLAEERYRTVLESAEMGAWDWNIVADKVIWNKEHYTMLGADPAHQPMSSDYFLHFIHPEDAERVKNVLYEAVTTKGVYHAEFRIVRGDNGEIRWMDGFGRVAATKDGEATRMVGVMTDITDRKKLEQQREEFIGIASHELKTPVTSIKAYAQVLQDMFEQKADARSAMLMHKMDVQVDRLTRLIQDLLDTTKIAEGQLSLHKEDFDIEVLILENIDAWQRLSTRHQIIWNNESTCPVYGDKERIGQVLTNFVSNAIKYSPDGGKVTICCQQQSEAVQLSVQDQGVGIPDDMQKKIFDRFFRVKDARLQNFPGLGLGLYISAGIIQRHNGTIHVESKLGEGSTFTFTLPAHSEK